MRTLKLKRGTRGRRGNALIEFSLLLPWIVFLFAATFDLGFYYYALESVQNAARAAALHTSANTVTSMDQSAACWLAIEQLRGLPNVGQSFASGCTSDPITVNAGYCDGTNTCGPDSSSPDNHQAAYVTVTYRRPPLFHFPIQGVARVTRVSEMRLREGS